MTTITLDAPAKINLFLEVTGKRPDGYHELDTVMQTVSLCDRVTVTLDTRTEGVAVTCTGAGMPQGEGNIAHKAATLFLSAAKIRAGAVIHIEKNIPAMAGLGGGSADAAAVINALNLLSGKPLGEAELFRLAAKTGADVPFMLKRAGASRARGTGDIFEACAPLKNCRILICKGNDASATADAYARLDSSGLHTCPRTADSVTASLAAGDISGVAANLYNAFEPVILPTSPDATALRRLIAGSGADGVLMSGSGTAVFGIFTDGAALDSAYRQISALGMFASVCEPV